MYMDFSKDVMEGQGHGNYDRLPTENLPPLWLAYLSDPSNSGKIHSDVKARWLQGDQVVVDGMKSFARFADQGAPLTVMSRPHIRHKSALHPARLSPPPPLSPPRLHHPDCFASIRSRGSSE